VVVDNGGPYQLFLNDQANGSSAARITVKKNLNAFRIGSWNNDRYLDASIGELLIYTNALSAAERQATYEYLKGKWLNADRFGVLQCLTSNQLSATATVTVGTNAVLDLGGQSQTLAGIAGGGIVTNGGLAVAGIVEPGGAGAVGTLTFASAVTLSGVLSVDVSACSCDRLEVKGTLDLSNLAIRIENPAQLDRAQVYTLISCTSELTGDFLPTSVLSGAWFVRYDRQAGKALLVYRAGTLIKVL
jgi:hypothetical protein